MMRKLIAFACVVITCTIGSVYGHGGDDSDPSAVTMHGHGYGGLFGVLMQATQEDKIQRWYGKRADGHAPIGVMGDHTHKAGEWMVSYRYMHMSMKDMYDGTNKLSNQDLFNRGFTIAPISMNMEMHMFGAMYAPTDQITLMAMLPYVIKSMKHETMMGNKFTTRTAGFGDVKVSALVELFEGHGHRLQVNFGVSIPTGSIAQRDRTPMSDRAALPYPMQIGSGTFDLMPGLVYMGQTEFISWGAELKGTLRLGENDRGYTLGDRVETSAWVSLQVVKWTSQSLRLKYTHWGTVDGRDRYIPTMMGNMIPTADPANHGGERLELFIGTNFMIGWEWLKGTRAAVELGLPVYQNLDGPQMGVKWTLNLGLQYAF